MEKTIRAIKNHFAEKIFADIDEAIDKCTFPNPRPWNDPQFKKYYEEIKKKWNVK